MNKKQMIPLITTVVLGSFMFNEVEVNASSDRLEELETQQEELQNQENNLDEAIIEREEQMEVLGIEKEELEEDLDHLQEDIDELIGKINEQEEKIEKIETEIERLQEEIEQLESQIDSRQQQLESQARAVQTQASPEDILDLLLSSESISDLLSRIGVVTQLIDANQNVMQSQIDDQATLEEREVQVVQEQEEVQSVKEQLDIDRNNLIAQRMEAENKIIQIAEQLDVTAEERESFVTEQLLLADRTSALNEELLIEQQRIEEEQQRAEAERREAEARAQAEAESREVSSETNPDLNNESETNSNEVSTSSSETGWLLPASGRVTSPFGWRTHPIYGDQRFHSGIDIAGSGSILAARSGIVTEAAYHNSMGYYIRINHGDGYESAYLHMQPNLLVSPGQNVSQGQQIGTMGTTGDSTGVHLDFRINKNGTYVDPAPYIGL